MIRWGGTRHLGGIDDVIRLTEFFGSIALIISRPLPEAQPDPFKLDARSLGNMDAAPDRVFIICMAKWQGEA